MKLTVWCEDFVIIKDDDESNTLTANKWVITVANDSSNYSVFKVLLGKMLDY